MNMAMKVRENTVYAQDADDFMEWVVTAEKGDARVYFIGHLSAAIGHEEVANSRTLKQNPRAAILEPIKDIRRAASRAEGAGKVSLVQRRAGEVFEYIAQRR